MMICEFCGRDEPLPFKCGYCGGHFCGGHRLPENHACTEIQRVRKPLGSQSRPYSNGLRFLRRLYSNGPLNRSSRTSWICSTEIRHMIIGAILVTMVGLSFTRWSGPLWFTVSSALVFFAAFFIHELAHKLEAQRHGLWAEFRVEPYGAILTAISIISPFKIIAPGAMVVSGSPDVATVGRVAAAGPLVNLILVPLMYLAFHQASSYIGMMLLYGVYINIFIAFFNLIPLSVFDGRKILMWSKKVWGGMFTVSLILLLAVWGIIPL